MINVAVVVRQPMLRDGVRSWLRTEADGIAVVAATSSVEELVADVRVSADVAVIGFASADGALSPAPVVRAVGAGLGVVVVVRTDDDDAARRATAAGARACLTWQCPTDALARAVRQVAAGQEYFPVPDNADRDEVRVALSPQEAATLVSYVEGAPLKSVARQLGISENTARSYLRRVRQKYADAGDDPGTKISLYQLAQRDGWVTGSRDADRSIG